MNSSNRNSTVRVGRGSASVFRYAIMIAFALAAVYPFFWIFISSLKSSDEIFGNPFGLPAAPHWENYATAWETAKIGTYLLNSGLVSAFAVTIVVVVSSMAAFVLARVKENVYIYLYLTLGIMIPIHTILIPTFILLKNMSLYNSLAGLTLIYAVSNLSIAVFFLVGFMKTIPRELEEAAIMDGASLTRVFFNIIFPISRPAVATIGTLAFLNCWNEYLFAYVLISRAELKTITQGIFLLQGVYSTNYGPLTAGMVLSILPVMAIYLLCRQVIEG